MLKKELIIDLVESILKQCRGKNMLEPGIAIAIINEILENKQIDKVTKSVLINNIMQTTNNDLPLGYILDFEKALIKYAAISGASGYYIPLSKWMRNDFNPYKIIPALGAFYFYEIPQSEVVSLEFFFISDTHHLDLKLSLPIYSLTESECKILANAIQVSYDYFKEKLIKDCINETIIYAAIDVFNKEKNKCCNRHLQQINISDNIFSIYKDIYIKYNQAMETLNKGKSL